MPIPKTNILESLINGSQFRSLPQATQKAVLNAWRARTAFNPNTLQIHLRSQPYANEWERSLRLIAKDQLKSGLPFGITQLDNGNYKWLRGNTEELSRIYFGLRNRLINPEYDISRAHAPGLEYGIESGKMFFGGVGDQFLVYPYAYSQKIAGKGKLGDLYFTPSEVSAYSSYPNKYHEAAMELQKYGTALSNQFNQAIKAGNIDAAADILVQIQSFPEFNQPWLMDRIESLVPKEKANLDYVPVERQMEGRRQLGAFVKPVFFQDKRSTPTLISTMKNGRINFDDPRARVFSGNPEAMGNTVIGGYFLRPGTRLAVPGVSMPSGWKYQPSFSDWNRFTTGYKQLPEDLSIDFENEKSVFTDRIGKIYDSRGYDATLVPVRDFHQAKESKGVPSLLMTSWDKAQTSLYPYGMYQEFRKNGGKIARFKSKLHK